MKQKPQTPAPPAEPTTFDKRVKVRELLFTFKDAEDWADHAQGLYRAFGHTSESTIAIDTAGMICTRGKQFQEARYPIGVYSIDDPPFHPAGMRGPREPAR